MGDVEVSRMPAHCHRHVSYSVKDAGLRHCSERRRCQSVDARAHSATTLGCEFLNGNTSLHFTAQT